jgi:superfamily II DNA helicase RecQ
MAALVRHFGDVDDAAKSCGICDVCDPAGAVLRLFRHPSQQERAWMQEIADELRPVDYKAAGTLQRNLGLADTLSRNEFDALLAAMTQAGLVEIEDAEYEKDGETRRYRKVKLTERGLELRSTTKLEILIPDGVVEEFGGRAEAPARSRKGKTSKPGKSTDTAPVQLTAQDELLAARLREWRAAEAKRLGVPAYLVLHDRSLTALAHQRPRNPNQLLAIDGIGPAKVEKFGEVLLGLCAAK